MRMPDGTTPIGPGGVGMDWEDSFPFVLVGFIASLVLALKALRDARSSRAQVAALAEKFYMVDHRLFRLAEQMALLRGAAPEETPPAAEVAAPPEPVPVS